MELQGELSDFPLADILQIICLSKKTGTLLVSGGERRGMIVFVRGKIVQAITDSSPSSLGDLLVERQLIGPFELEQALKLQGRTVPHRLLGSLLVELGFVERYMLNQRVREQIQYAIGGLVALRRGLFELKLNVVPIGRARPYPGQDFVLTEGCDVEELLLEVATAQDEASRDAGFLAAGRSGPLRRPTSAPLVDLSEAVGDGVDEFSGVLDRELEEDPEVLLERLDPGNKFEERGRPKAPPATEHERFLRLQALLLELKNLTAHAEVALTILRCAAEVATRGVLFLVTDTEVRGQGQFGVLTAGGTSLSLADRLVREVRIALDEPSIITEAVRTCRTRVGRLGRTPAILRMLDRIGGADPDVVAAAVPMLCQGRVRVVLYIDNHPGEAEFNGLQELEVLVDQAGIVMEKILLEQRLAEIQLSVSEGPA